MKQRGKYILRRIAGLEDMDLLYIEYAFKGLILL
jgi:hypothetical protein